jgi:hypothetical protein
MIELSISSRRIALALTSIVAILVLGHVTGLIFRFGLDHGRAFGLVSLFDLRIEQNFPTYYSALALLLSATLALCIAVGKRRLGHPFATHWFVLGLVFVYLSCDEIMELHERTLRPVRDLVDASGFLYFAWVIPFGIAVVLFAASYIPFLRALPSRFSLIFVAAGSIYVMGAIGFESMSAKVFFDTGSYQSPFFVLFYSLEEIFEMAGIVLFIYGLTSYISSEMKGLRIVIE